MIKYIINKMAGLVLSGVIGSGISIYGMYDSIKKLNSISRQKTDLLSTVQSLSTVLSDSYINPTERNSILTYYVPANKCGFVKAEEKNTSLQTTVVCDRNSATVLRNITSEWRDIGTIPYGLDMGCDQLIPPSDMDKLVHNCYSMDESTGNSHWAKIYMKERFGLLNIVMSNSDKIKLLNYPFTSAPVYMYGWKTINGNFNADIMGNDKDMVVDKVFEREKNDNVIYLTGSVVGLVFSFVLIGASTLKF